MPPMNDNIALATEKVKTLDDPCEAAPLWCVLLLPLLPLLPPPLTVVVPPVPVLFPIFPTGGCSTGKQSGMVRFLSTRRSENRPQ